MQRKRTCFPVLATQKTPHDDSACPYQLLPRCFGLAVVDAYCEPPYPQAREGGDKNGVRPRAGSHRVQLPQSIEYADIFAYAGPHFEAPIYRQIEASQCLLACYFVQEG